MSHFVLGRHGERHRRRLSGKTLWLASTNSIFTQWAGRQPGDIDCIEVTRVRPQPGQVVDGYADA